MWIKIEAVLCCLIATSLASNQPHTKRKSDNRGKRNLEYNVAHHSSAPRGERRIAISHPQYPLFYPVQRPYNLRQDRRNSVAPPYAVPMEPLIHYSERDPLYDSRYAPPVPDANNDLRSREDSAKESTHINPVYGQPPPQHHHPHPHVIERPIYIREPEPIIEIIIKESNITLPPLPSPPVTVPTRKKEQVHVFYVKYKKNPNGGYGKDELIYDKPIPAITQHEPADTPQEEPPLVHYESPDPTISPLPSTTLRAIVKPDSESYHADKGIHITFGKTENEQYKRSHIPKDFKHDSKPEPSIARHEEKLLNIQPQARQFNEFSSSSKQFSPDPSFFRSVNQRYQNTFPSIKGPPQNKPFLDFPPNLNQFQFNRPPDGPPFQSFSNGPNRGPPEGPSFPSFSNGPIRGPPDGPSFQSFSNGPFRGPPDGPSFNSFSNGPFRGPPDGSIRGPPDGPIRGPPDSPIRGPQDGPPFSSFPSGPIRGHPGPGNFNGPSSFSLQKPFSQPPQHSDQPKIPFNQGGQTRRPVPYQPFDNYRPQNNQPPQFQFQHHTHFPVNQHLPASQTEAPFNPELLGEQKHVQATQQQYQNNLKNEELIRQQQINFHNIQPQKQPPPFKQLPPQANPQSQQPFNSFQQQYYNQQNQQLFSTQQNLQLPPQVEKVIPPGGELIPSVPKYEQHISIPANPSQSSSSQNVAYQQQQQQQSQSISNNQYANQQQQFQNEPSVKSPSQSQNVYQQTQNRINDQYLQSLQQQYANNLQSNPQSNYNANNDNFKQHLTNQQIQLQLQSKQTQNAANNVYSQPQTIYIQQTTSKPKYQSSTTQAPKTTTEQPTKLTEKDLKDLNIELPDEVPEDLRQQLLSSGILKNAQISVLDYDKVGDIPLSALPPDQLANFYGAGGGQQIAAGSEPQPVVVTKEGEEANNRKSDDSEMEAQESALNEVAVKAPVQMKVVRYDPETTDGQEVKNAYVQPDATQVQPVALNDHQYNRYLPVKVNGATFPIPNVPELIDRKINSVVVLAPVDYNFNENQRPTRAVGGSSKDPRYLAKKALKKLIESPSMENFKEWLDIENKTVADKQAVVLLVTGNESVPGEKEIFMYDIATKTVNRLNGELSSAFVDAAETNSQQTIDKLTETSSELVEVKIPEANEDMLTSASEYENVKIPIIDTSLNNVYSDSAESFNKFVDISDLLETKDDLTAAASDSNALANQVLISSGYSKTGSNLLSQ